MYFSFSGIGYTKLQNKKKQHIEMALESSINCLKIQVFLISNRLVSLPDTQCKKICLSSTGTFDRPTEPSAQDNGSILCTLQYHP